MTFLGLKQPAWASEKVLTLVTASKGAPVGPDNKKEILHHAIAAHTFILSELQQWRKRDLEEQQDL